MSEVFHVRMKPQESEHQILLFVTIHAVMLVYTGFRYLFSTTQPNGQSLLRGEGAYLA